MEDARHIAYQILHDVTNEGSYFNLALKNRLKADLSADDRRFAASLSALALERMTALDYYLEPFITAKRVHAGIRDVLRLGACQMLYMNVPESAAVNESVKLAKRIGKQALSGFVNAVLRSFAKGYKSVPLPDEKLEPERNLSVRYGFPLWMVRRFTEEFGPGKAKAFFSFEADTKATSVRMNALKTNPAEFEEALIKEGFEFEKSPLAEHGYRIQCLADIENTALYREGKLTVMGEASMLAVEVLKPFLREGTLLLDTCAAPGGKSAYAAALCGNAVHITAWDIHSHRAELIRKNFERLAVQNYRIEVKDASRHEPSCGGRFDMVMIDAPCSALGLIHKKPDIRINRKEEDIAALSGTQRSILRACAGYVKKGGVLAYFTCTLLREENELAVQAFLQEDGRFRPAKELNLPEPLKSRVQKGCVTLKPHVDGTDGFFISLMERVK